MTREEASEKARRAVIPGLETSLEGHALDEAIDRVAELLLRETDALQASLDVAHQIEGTFWEALKPLKLTHIKVENPGVHVTQVIADRDRLLRETEEADALLREVIDKRGIYPGSVVPSTVIRKIRARFEAEVEARR